MNTYRLLKAFQPFPRLFLCTEVRIIVQIIDISQNFFDFRLIHFSFATVTLINFVVSPLCTENLYALGLSFLSVFEEWFLVDQFTYFRRKYLNAPLKVARFDSNGQKSLKV